VGVAAGITCNSLRTRARFDLRWTARRDHLGQLGISDESLNPLPEPARLPQDATPTVGGRVFGLTPYVNVRAGSSPDAVAIGDVTGDALADAVMSTGLNFDPDNDHSVFVCARNAAARLGTPVPTAYNQTANRNGLAIINADGTPSPSLRQRIRFGRIQRVHRTTCRE